MDKNFFNKVRILDGGMGQELLARGMEPNGTLWSANALLQEKYHQLLLDTHLAFVKAGAEIIVTNTFTTRKLRLKDNNVLEKYEYLNKKAGEIAQKVKETYPNILVAGGLPPQNLTYAVDDRSEEEISENFNTQAKLLNPYVDFFYFDVLSSVREFKIAIESIKEFGKPYLIGAHISEGTNLPSGEKISKIINDINHNKLMGIMLSCISPENYQLKLDLSKILIAKGENEEAINQLLEIIEVNPKWNDGEARKQLIEIFNILGNENILVTEGRKKLSSMLFS